MNATMNDERALATLQALADGVDPATGATFPAGSSYQHPDTVRALYHAIRAIEARLARLGKVPMPAGMRGSRTPEPGVKEPAAA